MIMLRRHVVLKIALVATGFFVAIAWKNHNSEVSKMTNAIEAMPMRTLCVGRFLVDVPKAAVVSHRGASLAGWDISSREETDAQFEIAQQETLANLKSQKNLQGGASLESVREVRYGDLHGRILVFNGRQLEEYADGLKTVEHVASIRATVRLRNITYEFDSELASDEEIGDLENIIKQLKWRGENEMPEQAGFCFNGALLSEPLSASQAEFTGIFVGLRSHPDLAISLHSMAGIDPGKTLLQRDAENGVKLQYINRFHVLREGPRSLNGIPGEEILERVDEPNGSTLQSFMWESLSKKDDVYLPNLILEFSTGRGKPGAPVSSSMSDAEALALWQKISSSLRRRPIQSAKPASNSQVGT